MSKMTHRMGTAVALAVALVGFPQLVVGDAGASSAVPRKTTDREARLMAVSAVLMDEFTTNATMVAKLMVPTARRDWVSFCRSMTVDGKQYFLPDFFKVKYTFIGGVDDTTFALGAYSPFYDSFMLMRVRYREKIPFIESFRIASAARLRGSARPSPFPPSAGTNASEKYFSVLSEQVRLAGEAFHAKFLGEGAPAAVERLEMPLDDERVMLKNTLEARLGLFYTVATDMRIKAEAVLADLVMRDAKFGGKKCVSADKPTRKVLDALNALPDSMRGNLQLVSYFRAGDVPSFVYLIPSLPTVLIQASVRNGAVTLKMFDARLVNDKRIAAK